MTPGHTGQGRAKALEAADLRREGWSYEKIGRRDGVSGAAIRMRLQAGCPPFIGWPVSGPWLARGPTMRPLREPEPMLHGERPMWSYPDPITMKLVREAKEEMRKAEW